MNLRIAEHPLFVGLAATALVSCLAGYIAHEESRAPLLEIYVIALKGGRAVFIRTPDDQRILVNGGQNSEIVKQITHVLPFYSRRIDTVIATDTDLKNVTGLIDIIGRYDVRHAYFPRYTLDNIGLASTAGPSFQVFKSSLAEKRVNVREIGAGDQVRISGLEGVTPEPSPPVTLHALFPVDPSVFSYSKASPPQIIFTIEHGMNRFTFVDDASVKVQKTIANSTTTKQLFDMDDLDSILITSKAGKIGDSAAELIKIIQPSWLIFEQTISAKSSSASSAKAQKKADPLAGILLGHRFNVRALKVVRILSDGVTVEIETTP